MESSKIDQENSSISSEGADIFEAQRLEIEQLKRDLAYHKSKLVEFKEQNSQVDAASLFHSSESENLSLSIDLQADLHRFAGMHCVKLDKACVFQFLTGHKVTKNDIYVVEILQAGGHQRLGRWVMPMSIDLRDLVLEYPLENPKNIKPFLKCCKHHIDCYFSRREQYYQLKDFLSDARNCFLDTTLGYLQVHLHMSGIKMIDSERIYNISLYMGYESDRAFPYKMVTELREGKMLPPEVAPYFSKFFKPFKKYRLQEAFEKVISNTNFFQWTKVPYDYDEYLLLPDSEHHEGEHNEEGPDKLNETETSRKLYKRKGKEKNKTKNIKNDLIGLEETSRGEKSLRSEEEEERPKPARIVNEARASKGASAATRRKSKRIVTSKTKNLNIEQYLTNKVKGTTEENESTVEKKLTMEKQRENSKEGENSKEWENLKKIECSKERENSGEKDHSIGKENSREKENSIGQENPRGQEDEQINRTDNMINPSGDTRNDNVEISNDGSDRTVNEVEKKISLNKATPLSKSSEQIETEVVGKSKKGRDVRKSLRRKSNVSNVSNVSNISNLSTKSVTNADVVRNDNEPTMVPTNINRVNIISSTPISSKTARKLCISQCSEISEISSSAIAKSKKDDHTAIEQYIPNKEIPEEDTVSSSISDDIGEENAYEEAKALLKDIENALKKDEEVKRNTRKNKKMRKKKSKVP